MPQKAFVLSGTVRQNVAPGEKKPSEERLEKAIEAACLNDDLNRLPKGDRTEVGERGLVLSGGQQQRLAIARALYNPETDLIFADDPLSALDSIVAAKVFAVLEKFVQESSGRCTCVT